MRHILVGTLVLALARPPISAQKIDSETPSRERVVRVQTAMNHLTVIEVTEPVTTVAVGSRRLSRWSAVKTRYLFNHCKKT